MAKDIFGAVADQIGSQFSLGENLDRTLDLAKDGNVKQYGKLGSFADKFDHSSQRNYLEEGYLRHDPTNVSPKFSHIKWQQPSATVLIKKRMFSSLAENHQPEFMDQDERIFYKASKILFANKAMKISAFEKLCKIQNVSEQNGGIPDQLMPILFGISDIFTQDAKSSNPVMTGLSLGSGFEKFNKYISIFKKVYSFTNTAKHTAWLKNIYDSKSLGIGVFELTNFTNFSTSCSLDPNNSFSLTITDPYELMLITSYDIEKALAEAGSAVNTSALFKFGKEAYASLIENDLKELNRIRKYRGANPIIIKTNPDTIIGKRVVALVDNIGAEISFEYSPSLNVFYNSGTIKDEYAVFGGVKLHKGMLLGGVVLEKDGLSIGDPRGLDSNQTKIESNSEVSLFSKIITNTFNHLSALANSNVIYAGNNEVLNYARRKLLFTFLGKQMIQHMDVAHFYINSRTKNDGKVLSGLENIINGQSILQRMNNSVTDLKNSIGNLLMPSSNTDLQMEKSVFVGADFPNALWLQVRNIFISEKEGTQIMQGVVGKATPSFNGTSFAVNISGQDNMRYLDMGLVNFKPSQNQFNGSFFDPLTPFKTKFDTVSSVTKNNNPELLDENKILLNSNLLKIKTGPNAKSVANEDSIFSDRRFENNNEIKIMHAPDGLVYKWKEGIGILASTAGSSNLYDFNAVGNFSTMQQPFSGQDVMNVISLSITGEPYNFVTFYKATAAIDGFSRDPQSGQDAAHSFMFSLKQDLSKRNMLWGNFIPFKNLVVDEKTSSQLLHSQFSVLNNNRDIDENIKTLQRLQQLKLLSPVEAQAVNLDSEIVRITEAVNQASKEISNELQQPENSSLILTGEDVTIDSDEYLNSNPTNAAITKPDLRRKLRKKTNFLTRRMAWQVRANEDKNLFIVDDSYDKDLDLIAFSKEIGNNISLYNNEYLTVSQSVQTVSKLLNLEVFCDSQGHIRVRPPQYNRIPSSVFQRLLFLKQKTGIQIFPQFIEDLFLDQLKGLTSQVEVIEDNIRLRCALLNKQTDEQDCVEVLNRGSYVGARQSDFRYVSDSDGSILDLSIIATAANIDDAKSSDSQALVAKRRAELISTQANKIKNNFTAVQRSQFVTDWLKHIETPSKGSDPFHNTRVNEIADRIRMKSGQNIDVDTYRFKAFGGDGEETSLASNQSVDVYRVTKDIADLVNQRQKALKVLSNVIRNAKDVKALDNSSTANNLLYPGLHGNAEVPSIFENMIEDETNDDYGPGSGSRFIISNDKILSYTFDEDGPEYTMVQVNGELDIFKVAPPPELNFSLTAGASGNLMTSALAIDYDLWRMYGFKSGSALTIPFFSNVEKECAPYAAALLAQARKNIIKGSVTIVGNEHMQVGEVVYLENRGLLFYVDKVSHQYTEGKSFQTTLSLSYGHVPGEFIPSPIDMLGKVIYSNRDVGSITIHRQDDISPETNVGVIVLDGKVPENVDKIGDGVYGDFNKKVLTDIILKSAFVINQSFTKNTNQQAFIELRIYHNNVNAASVNLQKFADLIKGILTESGMSFGNKPGTQSPLPAQSPFAAGDKTKDVVKIKLINLQDKENNLSPSQKAFDQARSLAKSTALNKIESSLYNGVIDCWLKVEYVTPESKDAAKVGQ